MKVELTSTTKIVMLATNDGVIPARVWEGKTDSGIPCHAYITRIAVAKDQDATQFDRELQECKPPSRDVSLVPSHLKL